jgi:hypothetical protein
MLSTSNSLTLAFLKRREEITGKKLSKTQSSPQDTTLSRIITKINFLMMQRDQLVR